MACSRSVLRRLTATLLFLALSTGPSLAQSSPDPGKKKFPLKVTVQVRLRLESWDWFNTPLADGNYEFFASQIRVGIGQERKKWDWQIGDWGGLTHSAGAGAVEAGYQPKWKLKPWFRLGYFRSSGDGNPTDGDHNTFFQVLPTLRIYAEFFPA